MAGGINFKDVYAGFDSGGGGGFFFGLDYMNQLWSWGFNGSGELGLGVVPQLSPPQLLSLGGFNGTLSPGF